MMKLLSALRKCGKSCWMSLFVKVHQSAFIPRTSPWKFKVCEKEETTSCKDEKNLIIAYTYIQQFTFKRSAWNWKIASCESLQSQKRNMREFERSWNVRKTVENRNHLFDLWENVVFFLGIFPNVYRVKRKIGERNCEFSLRFSHREKIFIFRHSIVAFHQATISHYENIADINILRLVVFKFFYYSSNFTEFERFQDILLLAMCSLQIAIDDKVKKSNNWWRFRKFQWFEFEVKEIVYSKTTKRV